MAFTMRGITSKLKHISATAAFALLAMTGYLLLYKRSPSFHPPLLVDTVRGGSQSYERHNDRMIASHSIVTSQLDNATLTENTDETRGNPLPEKVFIISAANEKVKSEVDNKELADNIKVGEDSTTEWEAEWDMFDSDHIDVALFTCKAKLGSKKRIYRNIKCPSTKRTISFRNALGNVTEASTADVVIFAEGVGSLKRLHELKELRKKRPHQMWLYTTTESAYQTAFVPHFSARFDATILNMSYCYHSKAEVVAPYGGYIERLDGEYDKATTLITPKPDIPTLAAWASSHCDHTFWNRTGFVRDLSKHLPMDLFGACGGHHIPRNESGSEILKNYKFYIAFENSCCSYYITEKFWKALGEYESVPIVIGSPKSEYESVAPPNSFVYADDFDSMEDLANYIKKVAKDEALYNKFHEWRKYGRAEVYTNRLVRPFVEDQSACRLLNYLEKNAWRKNHPIQMKIDPFGPDWAGSCISCGNHNWIKDYGLASKNFTKHLHSVQMTEV